MSDVLNEAVAALADKLGDTDIGGSVKFTIEGEGSVIVDDSGARIGDDDADVTLSADADTFKGMMDGSENPTAAFMGGKLKIDGDMGLAMKLAGAL